MALDGSGDYVYAGDSPDWDMDSNFTTDFWVAFNEKPPAFVQLLGTMTSDSRYITPGWFIGYEKAQGGLVLGYHDGSSWKVYMGSPWNVSANTWYHVAVARDAGTIRTFINGQQTGSLAYTGALNSNSPNLFAGG